jgi:hypothetical protein
MTEYTYTLSSLFASGCNQSKFRDEIVSNGTLPEVWFSSLSPVQLTILFATALTSEQEITLATLMSNHNSTPIIYELSKQMQIVFPSTNFDSANYSVVGTFKYPGSTISSVSHIQVISSMDISVTDYTMRIVNHDNNTIVAVQTFSNTVDALNNFTTFSNLPTVNAIFELQVKRLATGTGKTVRVKSLSISYF